MAADKNTMAVAREVIAGTYGSGQKRIDALKKAGYNPDVVQAEVNRLLCCRELMIANMQDWATRTANSHKYKYVYWTEKYGHECAVCHPHNGENKGWQCIGWGCAIWHHGGLPSKCNCGVLDNGTCERILAAKTDADALKIAQNALGIKDIKVIRNGGNVIPKEKAQAGDIGLLFTGSEFQHVIFVMSQSKISDSTTAGGYQNDISASRNFAGRYVSRLKVLIRYTGNGLIEADKTKSVDELAHEVINGLWLSGDRRQTALTQAGYDYNAVQNRVNEILNPDVTTVRIGQATSDENGNVHGGKAGDQTGGEVSMANWSYKSGSYNGWNVVYRAKDPSARNKIADACIKACNNNHIGYDQNSPDRKSCFKEAQKVNFQLDKITTNCELTCSELANVCIASAGLKSYLPVDKMAYVDSLKSKLNSSSEFVKYTGTAFVAKSDKLLPGDILISDSHTAIVVKTPKRSGTKSVDTLANEVLNNEWGSGDARKIALESFGYNYDAIQKRVNEILNPEKPKYTGTLPTFQIVKTNAQVIADTIEWAKWIAGDNNFHYGKGDKAHHNGCYFCGTQPASKKSLKGWERTYCCNPFVHAAWAHGGCVPTAHNMCLQGKSWDFGTGSGSYHKCSLFNNLGKPAQSKLKAGDVLCNNSHVALYLGNGKIAEAGAEDDNVKNSTKWNNSIRITTLNYSNFTRVYRFNSSVNTTYSIMHGEVSDRVGHLQAFLNWKLNSGLTVDREYGDKTFEAVKAYQKSKGLEADGIVGPATLTAIEGDSK